MRFAIAILYLAAVCACTAPVADQNAPSPSPASATPMPRSDVGISALQKGGGELRHISYKGRWEFVSNRKDGRYAGASARSFHAGDSMTIVFVGDRIRIYGVTGPNGGRGSVIIPGRPARVVSFYSPQKRTHRLIYDSGRLNGTVQSAGVVVMAASAVHPTGYVNVDEIEVMSGV